MKESTPRNGTLLADLMRRKELSPRELFTETLEKIETANNNAFISLDPDQAAVYACRQEDDILKGRIISPLQGVPVAVKDNIAVRGLTIHAGSRAINRKCNEDALVVSNLRQSGMVIMGTANMHELGHGVTGENRHFGTPVNPWGEDLIPGGSSSGSAVAVSSGLCPLALGSDTAGSVRIPAALCGLLGLKPGWGRVSAKGIIPLTPSFDTVGLLTRSVNDLEAGWQSIAGHRYQQLSSLALKGLQVGLYLPGEIDQEVSQAVNIVITAMKKEGTNFNPVEIDTARFQESGQKIIFRESFHIHNGLLRRKELLGKDVAYCLEAGSKISAEEMARAVVQGREETEKITRLFTSSGGGNQLLILPTLPVAKIPLGAKRIACGGKSLPTAQVLTRFTYPASVSGLPALSFPVITGSLPVGLQVLAPSGEEERLIRFAGLLEKLGYGYKVPPGTREIS